jgi:hypothetical protein
VPNQTKFIKASVSLLDLRIEVQFDLPPHSKSKFDGIVVWINRPTQS